MFSNPFVMFKEAIRRLARINESGMRPRPDTCLNKPKQQREKHNQNISTQGCI